jgi:hypothetical protein
MASDGFGTAQMQILRLPPDPLRHCFR